MNLRNLVIGVVLLSAVGCFLPPRETPVGTVSDAGPGDGGNGGSEGGYQFAGCDVENPDQGCPGLATFYCAADSIRAAHAACAVDEDCTMQPVDNGCTGAFECYQPAVAASQAAAFKGQFESEVATYCAGNGGCMDSGLCPAPPSGGYVAACVQGTCQTVPSEVIPQPAPLTEAQCEWSLPDGSAACGNEGGPCLVLHRKGQAPTAVLTGADFVDDSFHFMSLVTDDYLFFATYRTVFTHPGPPRFVAAPALGGGMTDLLALPEHASLNNIEGAAWNPSWGLWFISDLNDVTPRRNVHLASNAGGELTGSSVAYPDVGAPVSNAVARGSGYLVAHADGLYEYYPAGRSRLVEQEGIRAIAANEDVVAYSVCAPPNFIDCTVHGYDRTALTTWAYTGFFGDVFSLAIVGDELFGLSGRYLFRAPLSGSVAAVRYEGGTLPQHSGTLLSRSLRADGNKLYFQQVCYFDADAPGYGTIELDPTLGTARWLNTDPDFPFVNNLGVYQGWGPSPWANAHGIYTLE